MRHSQCIIGPNRARLYFGATNLGGWLPPMNGLYLVVERPNRNPGPVTVIDGGLHLSSLGWRGVAILGKGRVKTGLRRGTFTVFEHLGDGKPSSRRFTGSWNCG